MNKSDTHPASLVELACRKGKEKASYHSHEKATSGPSLPGGRKLPHLAPKPIEINSESPSFTGKNFSHKRARVHEDPQGSSHLLQPTHHTAETMSLMDTAGSHMDNNINLPELNSSIGGSNIQSMANDVQASENHTLETHFDLLSGIQNHSPIEIPRPFHFANGFTSQPAPTMPQSSAPSYPTGSMLKICPICDARLIALRNHIMAIPDGGNAMQLLGIYFAIRDNWHGCHVQGFGGLDG
ncbi:hypothetical protein EV426DRAFT_591374 [Tirmania nivea]|nr:hypothetical protein EV426DRAFT_591374 [Tirmania nivea]